MKGLNSKRGRRGDLLATEQDLHSRLNYVELQARRLMHKDSPYNRRLTIGDGDFEPMGRRTMTIETIRSLRRPGPWAFSLGAAAGALVVGVGTWLV